jgi:hypothetical protein
MIFFASVEILAPAGALRASPLCNACGVLRGCEKFKMILTCAKCTGTAGIIATCKSKLHSRAQFMSTACMPGHGCVMIKLVIEKCPPCPYRPA